MNKRLIKIISIYEIVGGILGVIYCFLIVALSVKSIFNSQVSGTERLITFLLVAAVLSLYILTIAAGLFLWKGSGRGYTLSVLAQCFQIPYIITSGLTYIFISGAQLGVAVGTVAGDIKLSLLLYLGSKFGIFFNSEVNSTVIGINIVPILLIKYLKNAMKEKDQTNETGNDDLHDEHIAIT